MKINIEKRDFFKEPFSESELKKIIKITRKKPIELIRKRDKKYKELEFETKKYSNDQIIKFMIKYPGLIARPIVISGDEEIIKKNDLEKIK